jgi:tetratricopeptide (TPR) repeat protein
MTSDLGPVGQSTLDELWDFNDPVVSERRFLDAQEFEPDAARSAELLTQEARAVGLQGRYEEAWDLLESVEILSSVVEVRVLLEQGRVHNSSGRPADAVPLFEEAAKKATRERLDFLAIDALHMLAIADPESADARTREALELVDATDDRRTRRWGVSLHNNLGWALHNAERYDEALGEFEAAHAAALDVGTPEQEFVARWAIARCLRSLGRYQEALNLQERLAVEDSGDTYVTEEIAALHKALGDG